MHKVDLLLYDDLNPLHINWIDPKWGSFYSKVIPYKPWFIMLHKYDNVQNEHNYFIAFATEQVEGHRWSGVIKRGSYIKCNITNVWNDLPVVGKTEIMEVNITLVEEDDIISIYHIDI